MSYKTLPTISKKSSFMSIEIEEDEPVVQDKTSAEENKVKKVKKVVPRKSPVTLKRFCQEDPDILEVGVDEAGRGPLFGRVYCGAVILPKDDALFDHSLMKDSKKFTSKKKITEAAEYIKTHAISWGVAYSDENVIDNINILQATQRTMHLAIRDALRDAIRDALSDSITSSKTKSGLEIDKIHLLVDGNYFKPYLHGPDKILVSSQTVEQGDNTYSSIAAASILAKVARDQYIDDLCAEHPTLSEYYAIDSNKGYGAKKHLDGIKAHGITQWHRRTFGICKNYV
jgi:ribonuclease HII